MKKNEFYSVLADIYERWLASVIHARHCTWRGIEMNIRGACRGVNEKIKI